MKKSLCLILIAVLTFVTLCGCGKTKKSGNVNGIAIEFPQAAEGTIDFNQVTLLYNLKDLNNQMDDYLDKHKAYIFTCPNVADFEKIAAEFGFEKEKFVEREDGGRYYVDNSSDPNKRLDIEPNGCFSYSLTEEVDLNGEFKFTEEECAQIAKDFLKDKGFFPESISQTVSVNEESSTSFVDGNPVKTIISKGINFFRGEIEDASVYGNSRITAGINRNGNVDSVFYNYTDYEKKEETSLISIEDALALLKEGKCYILTEIYPQKVEIQTVSMMYYAQDRLDDDSNIQPVYCFIGTAEDANGTIDDQTVIMVQANKIK